MSELNFSITAHFTIHNMTMLLSEGLAPEVEMYSNLVNNSAINRMVHSGLLSMNFMHEISLTEKGINFVIANDLLERAANHPDYQ